MSQLTKNTTDLDALIAKANALPDAGTSENLTAVLDAQETLISELEAELEGKAAGGGSGSVETCTVNIVFTGGGANLLDITRAIYSTTDGLTTESYASQYNGGLVINNCQCDSLVFLRLGNGKYGSEYVSDVGTVSGDGEFLHCYAYDTDIVIRIGGTQDDVITVSIPTESDY